MYLYIVYVPLFSHHINASMYACIHFYVVFHHIHHCFPKQVSLSKKAERVLEEAIQDNTKGDVIYFWSRLNMNGGVTGSKDALTFWSACDILNEGHCRYII